MTVYKGNKLEGSTEDSVLEKGHTDGVPLKEIEQMSTEDLLPLMLSKMPDDIERYARLILDGFKAPEAREVVANKVMQLDNMHDLMVMIESERLRDSIAISMNMLTGRPMEELEVVCRRVYKGILLLAWDDLRKAEEESGEEGDGESDSE